MQAMKMNFTSRQSICELLTFPLRLFNSLLMPAVALPFLLLLSFTANAALSTELIELEHKPVAPRFSLPDMQDQQRELSDYHGKPVIISFWGTWCPPCRKEIPYFNRAHEKLKDDDVVMLFVNINESRETIEAFVKKVPIHLTILRDETAEQLANWNLTGLPVTFILDPEGRVAYQAMGERAWDSDEILDKVRKLKTDVDGVVKDGL
jgi:peroxiredoxin